jgi:hypothetical protein
MQTCVYFQIIDRELIFHSLTSIWSTTSYKHVFSVIFDMASAAMEAQELLGKKLKIGVFIVCSHDCEKRKCLAKVTVLSHQVFSEIKICKGYTILRWKP